MLNEYKFKSIFKNELSYFINFKRSSGLKYENEIFRLKYIDNIFFKMKIKSKKITKEIFNELTKRNNMQGENYVRQYGVTKDFCKFLISNGYNDICIYNIFVKKIFWFENLCLLLVLFEINLHT